MLRTSSRLPRSHSSLSSWGNSYPFTSTSTKTSTRSQQQKQLLTLLSIFLIGFFLFLILFFVRNPSFSSSSSTSTTTAPSNYVLVLDAGSSGTRIYAYTWKPAPGVTSKVSAAIKGADREAENDAANNSSLQQQQQQQQLLLLPTVTAIPATAAPDQIPRRAMPNRRAYHRVETEPGLDKFLGDIQGIEHTALGPLLTWADAVVPPSYRSTTPVFMFGTAGIRKLPLDEQEQLLTAARHALARSGFMFKPSWARTLSGVDEGVYGWIAVNYMAGTLNLSDDDDDEDSSIDGNNTNDDRATPTPTPPTTNSSRLGTLDLGGSSLEVCVDTTSLDNNNNNNDNLDINVLDTKYQLYCHVHQGYGLNDAFDRGASLLLAEELLKRKKTDTGGNSTTSSSTEGSGKKMEPPLPPIEPPIYTNTTSDDDGKKGTRGRVLLLGGKGKEDTTTTNQLLIKVHHPCLQQGYSEIYERLLATSTTYTSQQLELHKDIGTVLLIGAPDYKKCQELAAAVVNATAPCTLSQYSSNNNKAKCALGATQPDIPVSTKLKALTGFHVVQNFYAPLVASITQGEEEGREGGGGKKKGDTPSSSSITATLTQEEIDGAGRAFCSQSWDQVMKHHPGELQVEHYCFRVPYIINLLTKGLGLGWSQVEIDGTGSAGWTLGAALSEGVALAGLPTHINDDIKNNGIGAVNFNDNNNKSSWVVWNVEAMIWVGCLVGIAAAVVLYTKRRRNGVAVIGGDNTTNTTTTTTTTTSSGGGLNGLVSSLGGGRSGPGGGGGGGGGNVPFFGARVPSSQTLLPRRGSFLA